MSAAADTPRFTLTIGHFSKTIEGQQLIQAQRHFILGAQIYQGFNGVPVECAEKQMTDAEIEAAQDIDGTRERIWFNRKNRMHSRDLSKNKEMAERDRLSRQKRRDELELLKLERELAPEPPAPVADMDAAATCPHCFEEFENARKLQGHIMGKRRSGDSKHAAKE